MNMQQACDPDRLDAFVRGELSEQQESELTAHLDQCATCGEELERRVAAADQWREAGELLTHRTRRSRVADLANNPSTNGSSATSTTLAEQMDQVVGMLAPTDDPEMLGRIGGYEVSGVIGCGGMGVVFKAHDRSLDRVVAIKVMAPHLAGSGAARKRFARESKAAAAVLHPNVIAIHCVADDPKLPYLVMPYIGGASLQKRIEADGPLCTQDTLRIGQQIAAGLAAAHAQGLVHRDIKPANILLERGVERVTITDFGLARAVDDATMTRSGVIAGTPQYMSPEQARGESIDHRSDLFSLGSVLYMMCAGHSPFRAETTFGILRRITDNQPRPLREINPDVPDWLCAIIEKLHAKEPSERFQSAEEVAELLEGCLAHVQQPTGMPLPEAVAAIAPTRDRRLPIGKFIGAAAFAIALVFAGVFIVLELNKGTLTIQTEADDIRVRITHGDKVIDELKVTKSGQSVRVVAGQYKVEVIGETDDIIVENEQVTLHRSGNEVVRIVRKASYPSKNQTTPEKLSADEWQVKLQGYWTVVQQFVDNGVPKRNSYSATLRRNRMELTSADGQHSMLFELVLGEEGPPQQIDLKPVMSDLERQELQQGWSGIDESPPEALVNPIFYGIIELNGNTFRICNHVAPCSPRPIQFTDSSERVLWNFTRSDRDLSVESSNDGPLLSEAIRQFNEHQKTDPIGSKQPLLTDDEVIAAVRAMSREFAGINVSESNYKVLRDAIERGQLPKEWTIESSNQFRLSDGRFGERWTVQLSLHQGESSPQKYVFRARYVNIEPQASGAIPLMPEGHVSIAESLAKVNAPDPNIYATLPDLPVTEQEIVAALSDLIDKDQSIEFASQRKALQEIIETRSLPKEAEISLFRPHRNRGYVSRWSNREGFENEDWTLRFEYPYAQNGKQIVTAVHLGFRPISSRLVDHITDDEIHWGPVAQDGLQFGVAIEDVTLPDKSDLASAGAIAYKPHFYFRNPSKTDSTSIQLSDMYQHYEIDARTATGEQLPSKRRQGYYGISRLILPDQLNGGARIYKRASPFVVGTYAQTQFEDSMSLEPPDRQSFESFPSLAVNAPPDTPLRIRISIPHPLFSDSARLLSGEIRLPPLKLRQTNVNTAEDEKAKDEAAKAWLRRPVVGSTHDGKSFQLAGHDALMRCVMTNNSEALNRLLTMDKYDLDYCPLHGQWTLLQTALQHECLETTSLLLRHGANPKFASKGTPLPLDLAQRSGRKQLVALVQKYLERDTAPLAKLLTTWEEVEARIKSIVKEREAILNADVDFELDYSGNHTSKRRYHVWLNDLNRRSDCRGVSSDGTEDYSTIVTPTFECFDDHRDKSNSQFNRRDPKDPVGWGTLGCIVDIRKVGLVNWSIESIDTHEFDEDLLAKDRIETDVETGDCEGIPITIVKLKRKTDGVAESWTEYWLSPAHGNYPIYIANGWTESENSAEKYVVSQRTQWKFIDGVWFPTNVKHRYLCEQRKMDDIGIYELVTARLNVNPFPNVFDPLEELGVPDTSRKAEVKNLLASEQATQLAEKAEVANGEWPPSGFELTEQQIQRAIGAQSARIVRALDSPVDLLVDGKSSLAEIVSSIVRKHRISVRLNEKSFEEQGVAIHHVPAFEVHGVTLRSALTTMLEKLLQHRSIPPVIEVRHGVLTLAAKAPSDIATDLARSKPTSVVFQSMGPDKQVLPETVVEVQGSDGVYFVLSDQNGLAPVVGHGVSNWYTTARDASGQLMAYTSHGMFLSKPTKPYVLNFTAPQSLAVNVSDEHGRPIEGATVGILSERCRYQITDSTGRAEFLLPVNNQYVQAIFALKSGKGLDYISYQPQWATDLPRELSLQLVGARELKVRLLDEQNQLLKGVPIFPVKFDFVNSEEPKAEKSLSWWKSAMGAADWSATNEQGEVVIDWLPRDHAISFLTTNRELEHNVMNVTNLAEDVVEFRMTGPVEVSGQVLDIDGKPVAGASIAANNESGASADTDEEGRYVLKVRPGTTFYLEAVDASGGGWMAKRRGISDWVEAVAGQPSKNNDVVIRPTARVFGRVAYTFDSAPAANIQLSYQFHGPEGRDPIKLKDGAMLSRGYGINGYTDDDGQFEFYAVPGKYTVSAVPDGGRRAVREFTVVAAEPHEANMAISKTIPVKGRVIAGDPPMPLGRVTIKRKHLTDPFNLSGYDWSTNEAGELDQNYRDRDPMILWGHSEDKQLWGVTDMAWDDAEFEMKLAPRAEMKVRILNSDQKTVANTEFTYGIFRRVQPQYQKEEDRQEINVHSIEPREGTTDENGILTLKDLIFGGDYTIHMTSRHSKFERYPDSPIPQAKVLVASVAKDVVVDVVLR